LEERGWDAAALAARCELDAEEAARVLDGDLVITRARAREIGAALGTSGSLWYELRRSYEAWREDDPAEAGRWLTSEVRDALEEIAGPHLAKKRATVLLLAFATATDTSWTEIFEDPRVCNQRIWYQKWQYDAAIAAALELATEHALAWRDSRTAAIESRAAQERRRAIALGSLSAVKGLEVTALNRDDRADHRTEASRVLLSLADKELAERLAASGARALPVEVENAEDVRASQVVKFDLSDVPIAALEALAADAAGDPGAEE
jgi:plasmid maintenance system antidote protein VapI